MKIKEIGLLVGEIEKISPKYCKNLIQSYPGRFFSEKKDFIDAYLKIVQDAIKNGLSPNEIIIQGNEIDNFVYDKEKVKFLFFEGYNEISLQYQREIIGKKIADIRKKKGISQQQLADITGLIQNNIARIETGKYSTGLDILSKIAFALDVELSFIDSVE